LKKNKSHDKQKGSVPKDKKKEKDKRKRTRLVRSKRNQETKANTGAPKLHLPLTPRSQAVKKGQQTPPKSQRAIDNGDPRMPRTQYTKTRKDTKRTVNNTHKQDGTIRDQDASITKEYSAKNILKNEGLSPR